MNTLYARTKRAAARAVASGDRHKVLFTIGATLAIFMGAGSDVYAQEPIAEAQVPAAAATDKSTSHATAPSAGQPQEQPRATPTDRKVSAVDAREQMPSPSHDKPSSADPEPATPTAAITIADSPLPANAGAAAPTDRTGIDGVANVVKKKPVETRQRPAAPLGNAGNEQPSAAKQAMGPPVAPKAPAAVPLNPQPVRPAQAGAGKPAFPISVVPAAAVAAPADPPTSIGFSTALPAMAAAPVPDLGTAVVWPAWAASQTLLVTQVITQMLIGALLVMLLWTQRRVGRSVAHIGAVVVAQTAQTRVCLNALIDRTTALQVSLAALAARSAVAVTPAAATEAAPTATLPATGTPPQAIENTAEVSKACAKHPALSARINLSAWAWRWFEKDRAPDALFRRALPGLTPWREEVALGVVSIVGPVRTRNEDAAIAVTLSDGRRLLLSADGMGGEPDGHLASRLAILGACAGVQEALACWDTREAHAAAPATPSSEALLTAAFARARAALSEAAAHGRCDPMAATTLIAAVVDAERYVVGGVGDGGAYLRRADGKVESLMVIAKGSHVGELSRYLSATTPAVWDPSIQSAARAAGDVLMLGTDGVMDRSTPDALLNWLAHTMSKAGRAGAIGMQQAVRMIVDHFAATLDDCGCAIADDNMTLIALAP